jgi:hypothetical protein
LDRGGVALVTGFSALLAQLLQAVVDVLPEGGPGLLDALLNNEADLTVPR